MTSSVYSRPISAPTQKNHIPGHVPQKCLICQVHQQSVCITGNVSKLIDFANASQKLSFPPGTTLFEEGTAALASFNIISGTIRLFKSLPDGRRQITGFVNAGHFIDLTGSDTCCFGAESIDAVEVCKFFHPQLEHLLTSHPELKHYLINQLAINLAEAQEQMLLLGRKTAREKISSFLLSRAAHHLECNDKHTISVSLPMNRSDIADYLGLTIETVSRTLSALRREKIIIISTHHNIQIISINKLRTLASGQEHG